MHPTLPVTEITIRETVVNDNRIEEVEKKVSMPSLLLDNGKDETEDDKMKKSEQ